MCQPGAGADRELSRLDPGTLSIGAAHVDGAGVAVAAIKAMGDVEIVATYELYNINRTKLENLIHRIFEPARLEIEITDCFGRPVVLREWFLVPLFGIQEAVERVKDGTIAGYFYDPQKAQLMKRGA